jgi:hypothetical protein
MISTDLFIARLIRSYSPHLLLGFHNPYIAQCGAFTRTPSLIFTDTEHVGIATLLTYPFATKICTPSWFEEPVNSSRHMVFESFKELAYLHPLYFSPDPLIFSRLGLSPVDPYIILRFISWEASHDIRLKGMRQGSEGEVLRVLQQYGRVFISSERPLPPELETLRLTLPPQEIHSVLAHAALYFGEGGTMAAEAAILGTPSIHVEEDDRGLPTGARSGNFKRLRDRYDLLHFYADQQEALRDAMEILTTPGTKRAWQDKRQKLLNECVDVTSWMEKAVSHWDPVRNTWPS